MVAIIAQPTGIVKNGLILNLDASNTSSYPGTGTTWTDLTGNASGTIYNGGSYSISWVNAGLASYFNFSSQDTNYNPTKTYIGSSNAQNYLTMTLVFYPDFTLNTSSTLSAVVGSDTGGSGGTDASFRFANVNGTGPWQIKDADNSNGWTTSVVNFYDNNAVYNGNNNLATGWNILTAYRSNQTSGTNFAGAFNYFLGSGGYTGDNRNYRGRIGMILGYNRQLTAAESLQNYTALRSRFGV